MGLKASDLSPELRKRLGLTEPAKRNKYGARKQQVGDQLLDSQREAARYRELTYRVLAREIENLQCQPQFLITRDGCVVATYRADFRYRVRATGAWVIEDVKGGKATRTEAYRLRKALVEAQYGIVVQEV